MKNGIKLITLTANLRMHKMTLERLSLGVKIASSGYAMDVRVAESLLSGTFLNVLIWDYDFSPCNLTYLTTLTNKYNVLLILTSKSSSISIPVAKSGRIKFLSIPTSDVGFKMFADDIKKFITAFYSSVPKLSYAASAKTVTSQDRIISIAASTGGTVALEKILTKLEPDCPPILIVQHIITGFSHLFAERLNTICKVNVKEARTNDFLQKGLVLIAPADKHMILSKRDDKLTVECFVGEKVNCVMPAADVLFESIPKIMRGNVTGVILTGMGSDGARGLLKLRSAGAKTIGQDEATSVVYGMPKVAYDIGAVQKQLPLDGIFDEMLK
ncbi:MAG: CheB methylesterase domain-containing protein [Defluviitaleaceae bacterium]|nr:CheB methylesterase domain-containing protein [Defluviitaleaceae bacterium]